MTNYTDALRDFDTKGKAVTVSTGSNIVIPSIRLHDSEGENVGQFVAGTYLGRREAEGPNGKFVLLTLRLATTNAKATIKKGSSYPEAAVKAGDIINVFASSRLDRTVKDLELGTRIMVRYEGKKKIDTPRGKVFAHFFDVKAIADALAPEDREYLKTQEAATLSRQQAVVSRRTNEEEAEAALAQLED